MTAVYIIVVAIISLGALYELYCAFQRIGVRPSIWTGTLALIALFIGAGTETPVLALMGIINGYALISLAQHLTKKDLTGALTDWVFSLAAVLYVGLTMVHFVLIVRIEGPVDPSWFEDIGRAVGAGSALLGLAWLGVALVTTWATEVVVSVCGRVRSTHTRIADASPDASRIGPLAGLIAGTLIGGLSGMLFGVPEPLVVMLLIGGLIAIGAILGDRCESMIKRQLGANVAVRTVPGRGGLLHRIAALRVTVPLTFYLASLLQWHI